VQREATLTDYYPLVLRAVRGLDPNAPGESRRVLYERARAALISQLRSVQPPLSESELTRERLALERAIRQVEGERADVGVAHDSDVLFERHANGLSQTDLFMELAELIRETDLRLKADQREVSPATKRSVVEPTNGEDDPSRFRSGMSVKVASELGDAFGRLPPPPIDVIPDQEVATAIAFRPSRRGPLELLPDPPKDPHDPEQSQLYLRIRQQLKKLQADIPSQERAQIDDAVDDFLAQPESWQRIEFKKVLWLCGNALRNILAQHDAVKDSPEPHYSKLPAAVAEATRRPVEAWNVFVLGDPDLITLDAKRLGPQEQQSVVSDIETARPIVQSAAADRNITTEKTAEVLDAGLHAASASADNINTRQAQQVVAGTFKNLITQLVRRAYLTCLAIAEPKSDDDRALAIEYQKGIARGAGTGLGKVAVGTAVAAAAIAVPHAASFFEFVVQHAAVIREYFAISSHSPQLVQVIDTIEFVRLKLASEKH
jgi:hypothetical protein